MTHIIHVHRISRMSAHILLSLGADFTPTFLTWPLRSDGSAHVWLIRVCASCSYHNIHQRQTHAHNTL